MNFEFSERFAEQLDNQDLDVFKDMIQNFCKPSGPYGGKGIYFLGHSLGLQCHTTAIDIIQVLNEWKSVITSNEEHIKSCHKYFAHILGCLNSELALSGTLTQCIHQLFTRFYRPEGQKTKIYIDGPSFSSDIYAMKSQIELHGLRWEDHLIVQQPKNGAYLNSEEEILQKIDQEENKIAIMFFEGVNYLTGQLHDIAKITQYAKQRGIIVGWDLAHAIGNVELKLHEWNVDFACYCTYKFLNSGPHNFGGIFIHEQHFKNAQENSFLQGYYSYNNQEELKSDCYQYYMTPPNPILLSFMLAPAKIIFEVGIEKIRKRSQQLTSFLEFSLKQVDPENRKFQIITSQNPEQRGATLTLVFEQNAEDLTSKLRKQKIFVDFRKPNCMRICPSPYYATYSEIYIFVKEFNHLLQQ